jgi:hypothetical protein
MQKLKCILPVIITLILISSVNAQMIAHITGEVTTDFGTYRPYTAQFTPAVPSFTVAPDFSNVINYQRMSNEFNDEDERLLLKNHFTVKKSQYQQLYDIYNLCTWDGTPIFITSDALLHTYHVLFDRLLAEIELKHFTKILDDLTGTLIEETRFQMNRTKSALASDALHKNLAYLYVADRLLNGTETDVPDTVAALVNAEIDYIESHEGFHFSPVLGNFSRLDYSQFKPRGHYTRNDSLRAYFKTMIWYGWTIFTMEPELFGDLSSRHTLQAVLLIQMLNRLQSEGQPLSGLWETIYEPTIFFVGRTDDPNMYDYSEIAEQIYGNDFLTLSPDSLANPALLNDFMTEARKLPEPKIPNWIHGTYIQYKGFRFMGQRFIPDSYMFAHLVYPDVGTPSHQRWMPKGLDVMAILGSDRVFTLLDSVYQETAYENYAEKIETFNADFRDKADAEWAQNLYWNWLYCLMPLLYEKGSGYPYFMQTLAWADKALLTALASWAELRHDTILYAKQSVTPCGITPGPPRSYVEPNPHLYARLASLVDYTRTGLEQFDLLPVEFRDKLDLFERLLLFLRDVSIKELENIPMSTAEYENIFCFGEAMKRLVSEQRDPQNPWHSDTDDMAIVADVHTDSNTDRCLEEGVGYPLEIFVIVNEGGIVRITKGAIFSYYEFTRPITERLTDEEWREMLTDGKAPPMPRWTAGFMDVKAPQPQYITDSPDYLYDKEFTGIEGSVPQSTPRTHLLLSNYPNPFNPATLVTYRLPKSGKVTLRVYNISGQLIETLVEGYQLSGTHHVLWDATNFSSGIYFYKLRTVSYTEVGKCMLLR